MSKTGNITLGVVLIAAGVGATLVSVGSSGTGYVYWGLIAVGGWRVLRGMMAPDAGPSGISFTEQLEREGPSPGRQVVGATCVQCEKKVFADSDAEECRVCAEVVHLGDCAKAHRKAKHPKQKSPRAEA